MSNILFVVCGGGGGCLNKYILCTANIIDNN